MVVAWGTAHRGRPIWVDAGDAALPLTNIAGAAALALAGSGAYALDSALEVDLPRPLAVGALAAAAAAVLCLLGRAAMSPGRHTRPSQADARA